MAENETADEIGTAMSDSAEDRDAPTPDSASGREEQTPRHAGKARSPRSGSGKHPVEDAPMDDCLVIVDDAPLVDQERINEERRAYLEEAKSQEAFD